VSKTASVDWDREGLKFREHRGNLVESMTTVKEFRDIRDLSYYIFGELRQFGALRCAVTIVDYSGPDSRIGWRKTCVVMVDGYGVFGFTNGYGQGMPGMQVIMTEETRYGRDEFDQSEPPG
jgi:hypothetical protein